MSTIKAIKKKNKFNTESNSIRYLQSCLEGNNTEPLDSHMERYLIEYGLLTTSKQISNRGRVLLESYPNKSIIVLLFSEDTFEWLKGNLNYVQFEGSQILLIADNAEKVNHARFLEDLGIVREDEQERFTICDRYTMNFLKRFEQTYLQEDTLYNVGQSGPKTSIIVKEGATLNLTQVNGPLQGNVSQVGQVTDSDVNITQDNADNT